ncbi:MAG: cyclase [Bdellovibrio sp.]|nr:cyclase [Bdellovibrio sp.]
MQKIEFLSHVPVSIEVVKENFSEELFKYLLPPLFSLKVVRFEGVAKGAKYEFDFVGKLLPIQLPRPFSTKWSGEIVDAGEVQGGFYFVDEADDLPFPLKSWRHLHRILPNPQKGGIDILDMVEYSCHSPFFEYSLYPSFFSLFVFRKQRYAAFFRKNLKFSAE